MPKNAKIIKVLVLFHTAYRSERLSYVLDYVFKERLGLNYTLDSAESEQPIKITYGKDPLPGFIHFKDHGLLAEAGINKTLTSDDFFPEFNRDTFQLSSQQDIFSAIFYHLSRYEEYRGMRDKHGRFEYADSCLYKSGSLQIPIIDYYLRDLKGLIQNQFQISEKAFKPETFQIHAGLDIDSAFAYKGRSFFRHLAAAGKDLFKGRIHELKYRFEVLIGLKKDPNDNFGLQKDILGKTETTYFIQVGPYGTFDKNISPENSNFQKVICEIKQAGYRIALHPSYQSNSLLDPIQKEKKILESIIEEKVQASRQHFLRFNLPFTYRTLIDCGILSEYSMGYSDVPGFRAGTAFPFYWYDLEAEKTSPLKVYPFSVMDVAYKNFLKLDVEKTCFESGKIKDLCKTLNAPFHFVFHNESLSGHRGWKDWEKVLKFWCNG